MVTHALQRRTAPRATALAASPVAGAALLTLLLVASLFVRTRALASPFWIDEGLSVGIASFPLTEIPAVLRQDGSPPLYYLLLHVWMNVFGTSEADTHGLSLLFAILAIPAALWAGWSLFGRRTGWIAAALAALNPFLTVYAQETRMYSLVILLSILGTATFVHGFVFRRRRHVALFAVVLATMLYTHYWALFFALGAVAALAVTIRQQGERRALLLDASLVFGAALAAFAPWLPTLLYHAEHTGAPWSETPGPLELIGGITAVLSGQGTLVALVFGAGIGVANAIQQPLSRERTAVLATLAFAAATLVSAWLVSQITPAWAVRYLSVLVGPLLLVAAGGVARAGRLGLVAFTLVVLFWMGFRTGDEKSNVRDLAVTFEAALGPGDVVISTQPEQVPVLAYYFGHDKRYATPLGPVADTRVMDWRDALEKLESARVPASLEPLLSELPKGRRVLLVWPFVRNADAWEAPWTSLVRQRSYQWAGALAGDARFRRTQQYVPPYTEEAQRALRVDLFTKTRSG